MSNHPHDHDGVECDAPVRETGELRFGTIRYGVCTATDLEVEPWFL